MPRASYVHNIMCICDRFIIKVSSLRRQRRSHKSGVLVWSWTIVFHRIRTTHVRAARSVYTIHGRRQRWRRRLSFRKNVISYTKSYYTERAGSTSIVYDILYTIHTTGRITLLTRTKYSNWCFVGYFSPNRTHYRLSRSEKARTDHLHVESVSCYGLFCR